MKGEKTMVKNVRDRLENIARNMLENAVNASLSALQEFGKRIEDLSQAQEEDAKHE